MTEAPPLSQALRNVSASEDHDLATVVAGAINLYFDSMQRISTRRHLTGDDVFRISQMLETLLSSSDMEAGMKQVLRGPPKRD